MILLSVATPYGNRHSERDGGPKIHVRIFFQNLASSKFQQHYAPPLSNSRLQFHGIKWNVKNMHTKLSNAPVPKSNIVTKIQKQSMKSVK